MAAQSMAERKPGRAPRTYPEMGRRLREDRERLKLSQQDVADTISIAQSYVSQAELGEHRPDPDILRAYARLYGTPYARYAVPARYMDPLPDDAPFPIDDESYEYVKEIAAQPPAIVRALNGVMRELRIIYLTEGKPERPTDHGGGGR